jgi:hypothetical protein
MDVEVTGCWRLGVHEQPAETSTLMVGRIRYTLRFSGTSSASPILTRTVAAIQCLTKKTLGRPPLPIGYLSA